MPGGGAKPGERRGGRQKGSRNRRTIALEAILDKASKLGELPLEYMLKIMRDGKQPRARRDWAAGAAAPYIHPKLMPLMSAPQRRVDESAAEVRAALAKMQSATVVPPPADVQRRPLVKGKP